MYCKRLATGFLTIGMIGTVISLSLAGGHNMEDPYVGISEVYNDTIPVKDRSGDFINSPQNNPFDLDDPSLIEKNVEYDPVTDRYIITETIGDEYFRAPTYMTFEEYMEYRSNKQERDYFNALSGFNDEDDLEAQKKDPLAKLDLKKTLVDRLFGGNTVEISPQGSIDVTFGGDYQNNKNPTLPTRQQRRGGFDFDMDIQMSVTGKIGEKLNLNANYNTGATFNFDNQLKIDYDTENFGEDEIVKKIEAGNVSLPLKGSLITGSQSLFGIKTELQFGHLRLTALASQQRSKKESITLDKGAVEQEFEIRPDEYDENRHFFVSHYNRESYERALINLPEINSLFAIKNIEVWITDNGNNNRETRFRDIVALADLGTSDPDKITHSNPDFFLSQGAPKRDRYGNALPDNDANGLYQQLKDHPSASFRTEVVSTLTGPDFNMEAGKDFEKVRARRLESNEFTYHPELGFISLRVRPRENQVVAIAYEYRYRGEIYKMGELTNEVKSDSSGKVLFVKLLKSTVQNVEDPSWDLMMKNVYPIGAYNVTSDEFKMDIFYEAPDAKLKRFFEELRNGYPLINFFRLDNLNTQRDPQPDGIFDFVPGLTIIPQSGAVIFPMLEPFGESMRDQFYNIATDSAKAEQLYQQYGYPELYDETPTAARFNLERNRFFLKGTYKSSTSSEISLGAFNLPRGSVTVRAGGQILTPGSDYEIDYNIGRIKILNDAILQSGVPINITFEDNTLFSFQTKTMLGLRADYELSKDVNIGGTYLHLFEQPFTGKVNVGDDPINNRIVGLDLNMTKKAPWLTRAVDKLPFYDTKSESSITVQAEGAALIPGHSRAIDQSGSEGGVVYIDDFEGSASSILLSTPVNQWTLSSIPGGQPMEFPEANLNNDLANGANRARIAWYILDPNARRGSDGSHSYTREVDINDIFPNRQRIPGLQPLLRTFDMTFYPRERGPYNFDLKDGRGSYTAGVDQNNQLLEPDTRWGGVMKQLTTNDFEEANVEYLEFWVLNPFMAKQDGSPVSEGGKMQFHLGTISEDIFKDSRQQFENSLPVGGNNIPVENTAYGKISRDPPIIDNAFDNEDRDLQDIGFDGLNDMEERLYFEDYISNLTGHLLPSAQNEIQNDPANDNFIFFGSDTFGNQGAIQRYRFFNNPQGNSKSPSNATFVEAFTNYPDREDLNRDKSLNETENYFMYELNLNRVSSTGGNDYEIDIEDPSIRDRVTDTVHLLRGSNPTEIWYRFRVPINAPDKTIGNIQNFRSIQFFRMVYKGFTEQTTFRFAKLELVRNQWRRYEKEPCGDNRDLGKTSIDVVNIEEHNARLPFNYVVPEGIQRERTVGTFADQLQNEQSLALDIDDLPGQGCPRSIFKLLNLDMRNFERLKMFVHGETPEEITAEQDDLFVFIRMGRDFQENYYEYEIPLKVTANEPSNESDPDAIWPDDNDIDLPLSLFVDLKKMRNRDDTASVADEYVMNDPDNPENKVKIKGNPTLGYVKGILMGVRNKNESYTRTYDVEVWFNELRLTGLNERGGVAALGRVDMQLADLGNITLAGSFNGIGYGALDQKLADRAQENTYQFDASTNIELGKFLPKEAGLRIPFYAQYSNNTVVPLFDPVDDDIKLDYKLDNAETSAERDSIQDLAREVSTIKAFNFTNVRKERTGDKKKKPLPWNIENFSVSYFWSETEKQDPIIESHKITNQKGAIDYNYSLKPLYIEPFKFIKNENLELISDINFNPVPNSFGVSTVLDREASKRTFRFAPEDYATWENNRFFWNRDYNLKWDMTKSLKINFNARADAVIDELLYQPLRFGYVDPANPDTVITNPSETEVSDYRWENVKDLGRLKGYQHNISANYSLPFKKIPYMDWINSRASYNATYNWESGSLRTIDTLGSVIGNTQSIQISADFNFQRLYDKSDYLKQINRKRRPTRNRRSRGRSGAQRDDDNPDQDRRSSRRRRGNSGPSTIERVLIRPLMLLRSVKLTYKEDKSTVVPGFMDRPLFLGQSEGFASPGWEFVAGIQPTLGTSRDPGWLDEAAENGWITMNTNLSQEVIQTDNRRADAKISIEPFTDFEIDVTGEWSRTNSFSELFSDTIRNQTAELFHQVPYERGSYTISYYSIQTLFNNDIVELFRTFEGTRPAISRRLGQQYGITSLHDDPVEAKNGYVKGFGSQHVDVVIPAFLAAYSGKTGEEANLDYFNTLPRPNWNLKYDGLSRLPFFEDVFQNFTIRHAYRSTLTINNFETSLSYSETDNGTPETFVEDTRSFYAQYEIPTILVNEQFSPLLGVDIKTKNDITLKVDFKKSRSLSLQTDRYDMNEDKATEYVFGFGYTIKDVEFNFGGRKKRRRRRDDDKDKDGGLIFGRKTGGARNHDLQLSFDFSLRDNIRINYKLDDERDPEPLSGSKTLTISPAASYQLNENLNLRLFFDYTNTKPYVSNQFERTTMRGGITVQFQLN
ncbi:MAG: cell surface protein SprA [Saprospiraceae bacterium]|nr:cell surface protein SprA [Saprospiraceae bacterium]